MVRSWSGVARENGAAVGARRRLNPRVAALLASAVLPGVVLIGGLTMKSTRAAADGGAGPLSPDPRFRGIQTGGQDNATNPGGAGVGAYSSETGGGGGGAGYPTGGNGGDGTYCQPDRGQPNCKSLLVGSGGSGGRAFVAGGPPSAPAVNGADGGQYGAGGGGGAHGFVGATYNNGSFRGGNGGNGADYGHTSLGDGGGAGGYCLVLTGSGPTASFEIRPGATAGTAETAAVML